MSHNKETKLNETHCHQQQLGRKDALCNFMLWLKLSMTGNVNF